MASHLRAPLAFDLYAPLADSPAFLATSVTSPGVHLALQVWLVKEVVAGQMCELYPGSRHPVTTMNVCATLQAVDFVCYTLTQHHTHLQVELDINGDVKPQAGTSIDSILSTRSIINMIFP